jgi:hypothetical protein
MDGGVKSLFLDLIGYERGLAVTLIDLYRDPLSVIESNGKAAKKYISGNRLLLIAIGIWVFFNSLIIDWNTAISRYLYSKASLLGGFTPDAKVVDKISSVGADVMERYMAPIAVVYVALSTLIADRLCKHLSFSTKNHLEVMAYSTALYFMVMTVFSIVFAINGLIAEGLLILAGIINLTGYKNFLELEITRNYFKESGKEIEQNHKIAKGLAALILVAASLGIIIGIDKLL